MTPRNHKLFTTGNPKTEKGAKLGYYTAVLHLAPSDISGTNVCPMASPGCIATCLNTAGRGVFDAVKAARLRRTLEYIQDRAGFIDRLSEEVAWHERKAMETLGMTLAVRINGTSDLPSLARAVARRHPNVQFYDYTKIYGALFAAPRNLYYTFSRSELNARETAPLALRHGTNVAVVFDTPRGAPLPETYQGVPVIDGDEHDLRFLDPRGVCVGLRAKGKARRDESGFVVHTEAA